MSNNSGPASRRGRKKTMNAKFENEEWDAGWNRWCAADDREDCKNEMQRIGFDDAQKFASLHKKSAA